MGQKITLIDSGMPTSWEDSILPYLKKIGRVPKDVTLVICTHTHLDHLGSNKSIKEFCEAEIAMHELAAEESENPGFLRGRYLKRYDQYMTEDEKRLLMEEPLDQPEKIEVDIRLRDGDQMNIEGLELQVVHTPGHTEDCICLYNPESGILFTGDSVLGRGSARPIANVTNVQQYLTSVNKLKYLKIDTMLAGHAFRPFDPKIDSPVFKRRSAKKLIKESIAHSEELRVNILNSISDPIGITEIAKVVSKCLYGSEDKEMFVRKEVRAYLRTLVDEGWATMTLEEGRRLFKRSG